jgi:hypothetical protein
MTEILSFDAEVANLDAIIALPLQAVVTEWLQHSEQYEVQHHMSSKDAHIASYTYLHQSLLLLRLTLMFMNLRLIYALCTQRSPYNFSKNVYNYHNEVCTFQPPISLP